MINLILILVIVIFLFIAIRSILNNKKNGGCGGCPSSGTCSKSNNQNLTNK